jgi:hypothetical protein
MNCTSQFFSFESLLSNERKYAKSLFLNKPVVLELTSFEALKLHIKYLRTKFFWVISRRRTLRIGLICCNETSARIYHYSPRNNPEEWSSQLIRCVSLKTRMGIKCVRNIWKISLRKTWNRPEVKAEESKIIAVIILPLTLDSVDIYVKIYYLLATYYLYPNAYPNRCCSKC